MKSRRSLDPPSLAVPSDHQFPKHQLKGILHRNQWDVREAQLWVNRVEALESAIKSRRTWPYERATLSAVCHERRHEYRRCATVREMKEGPSRSAVRC